ncbi:histidine phosphatase family protein [bacterium]|nr:histidine phosphatase family protein [bacterium]
METVHLERVYIVRHGETEYNATGRWQGFLDVPLNDVGRRQAAQLAEYLHAHSETIERIYTSDLIRARETAEIIAQSYGLEVQTETRLRETNVGIFQGLTNREIDAQYADIHYLWSNDDTYVIPDGESRLQVQQRMMEVWHEWTRHLTLRHIMIVSHGGSIRWLLRGLFPHVDHSVYHVPNTSLSVVQRTERGWHLDRAGTVAHLKQD